MTGVVVVGAQWGDEGKGKIVDWLSSRADVIVRFQGGHNAGHTLVIDGKVYLFYKGWLGNAKKKWDDKLKAEGAKNTVKSADSGWKRLADADNAAFDAARAADGAKPAGR